jgi:hypothetical protein
MLLAMLGLHSGSDRVAPNPSLRFSINLKGHNTTKNNLHLKESLNNSKFERIFSIGGIVWLKKTSRMLRNVELGVVGFNVKY